MFSGIVEAVGIIRLAEALPSGGSRLVVEVPWSSPELGVGDSVAVDGVCLTVAELRPRAARFDVSPETLSRTTLGRRRPGDPVNLERALRLDARLGGHLVLGHVDAVVPVRWVRPAGEGMEAAFGLPDDLAPLVALKGSVAVDGVSLTVSALEPGAFRVALVPFTLRHTTLGHLRPDRRVNLEVDVLARYVQRQLEWLGKSGSIDPAAPGPRRGLTPERLPSVGFGSPVDGREGSQRCSH